MATVLNNTQANFDAFEYVRKGEDIGTRLIRITPGICKIDNDDLEILKQTRRFKKALDVGAVIINEGKPKTDTVKLIEPKPKKRKKKKASADFKDFD